MSDQVIQALWDYCNLPSNLLVPALALKKRVVDAESASFDL
jgi:hypothetical protein